MNSRIRSETDHLFEVFLEVVKPLSGEEVPYILQKFPIDYHDEEVLRSVPKFAFPYVTYHANQPLEHYSFVLTDIDSKFKFVFCSLSAQSSTHTCLCIVSCLPWYEIFYKLLDNLDRVINDSAGRTVSVLLDLLYNYQSFKPGELVSVIAGESHNETFSFNCPGSNHLPTIPESRNLLELLNCLDITNMLVMFASMINERRILIVSEMLSRLTACCHGAAPLLYPMYWQHLYIPVLPPHLLDYCSAPMPFMIGVHSSVMEKVRRQDLGDAVIVNVDTNTITSEYDDLETIPNDVVTTLKRHIKQCLADNKTSSRFVAGDGISRAFMTSLVTLIGGYRDALRFHPGEQITFDPDAFILSRPAGMQSFLKRALQMQTFQQFVADRLDMLNAGLGFSDEFDVQVNIYGDKWGTQSRYKDWLNHMKIQSKKLKREGRDKWLELSGKVKVKSKKAVKEFKMKIDNAKKDDAANKSDSQRHQSDPTKKPPRPPPPVRNYPPTAAPRPSVLTKASVQRTQHYHVIEVADDVQLSVSAVAWRGGSMERQSFDDSDIVGSLPRPSDMDLLSDPDILNACRKSYSLEDLTTIVSSVDSSSTETNSEDDLTLSWANKSPSVVCKSESLSPGIGLPSVASEPNFSTQADRNTDSISLPSAAFPVPRYTAASRRLSFDQNMTENSVSNHTDELLISLDDDSRPSISARSTRLPENITSAVESTNYAPVPRPRMSKQTGKQSAVDGFADVRWLTTEGVISQSSNVSPGSSPSLNLNRSSTSLQQSDEAVGSRGMSFSMGVKPPLNEARTMFMQSSVPPMTNIAPRQSSLDQFDPLSSGQLIVDSSLLSNRAARPDDDDLLKEWDLDFTGLFSISASTAGGVIGGLPRGVRGVPRHPMITTVPSTGFVSMPNLMRPVTGGAPVRYPGLVGGVRGYVPPVRPQWATNTPRVPSSMVRFAQPAFPVMQSMRVPDDGAAKSSTLPSGLTRSSFETSPAFGTRADKSGNLIDTSSTVDSFDGLTLNSDTRTEIKSLELLGMSSSSSELFSTKDKSSVGWERFE